MPKKKKPARQFCLSASPSITVDLSPAEIIAVARSHETLIRRMPKAYGEAIRDHPKMTDREAKTLRLLFEDRLRQHAARAKQLYGFIPD